MVSALKNDQSLKTLIGESVELRSHLALWDVQSFAHACGIGYGWDREARTLQGLQRSP